MFRPRIKWEHRPVRLGEDQVQIGGNVPGIRARIEDPTGWVWALVETLDGRRTVDQVVAELVHRFPDRSETEVRSEVVRDLGLLAGAGYVEDAAEPVPRTLSGRERERYSRAHAMWRWMTRDSRRSSWDTQLSLRQARIAVVGIGGTGSTAALGLVLSGVGHVHCVEPDVVELSNLSRQVLYTERDLGQRKVDVALHRLREHNSDVVVTGEAVTVRGPGDLATLAARFDVVVLAADQPPEIRSWTNQACLGTGTAWVHGGYHGPQINVGLYRPGGGACYDCACAAERERLATLPPRTPATATTGPLTQAGNAVSAGISGHLTAHAAMSLITGSPRLPANREYALNLVTLDAGTVLALDVPRPDCPACGGSTTIGHQL
ncbi:dinucleotide-utilizing protein [Actinophytocola xinjiangensis]|uniref:Dinucleotide-utilizing protein n=1 Tax=Actinophytocola xinjiangensis TaxID=485602 RepID=A0A7Z1AUA4_9PSEU|nr:ThiF family adenylyltransferase [Actinophytocola xinjiangensis]OLF04838.1 dinucleotide-utilizing protein [Actinophytocola xinjiangensis]